MKLNFNIYTQVAFNLVSALPRGMQQAGKSENGLFGAECVEEKYGK